jgi:hypothetical protein
MVAFDVSLGLVALSEVQKIHKRRTDNKGRTMVLQNRTIIFSLENKKGRHMRPSILSSGPCNGNLNEAQATDVTT